MVANTQDDQYHYDFNIIVEKTITLHSKITILHSCNT
jgi:hypothetical protein